ncbi:unnamed protein product [Cuscuta epithymum]|uniref:Uncharacterized protein n=1 Tax=Cuscuta epithymum TaxID=186058 RepID=A0AAV0GB93_9ASTE|nr:unnamed protein product [Cuscuta epithymum]
MIRIAVTSRVRIPAVNDIFGEGLHIRRVYFECNTNQSFIDLQAPLQLGSVPPPLLTCSGGGIVDERLRCYVIAV